MSDHRYTGRFEVDRALNSLAPPVTDMEQSHSVIMARIRNAMKEGFILQRIDIDTTMKRAFPLL